MNVWKSCIQRKQIQIINNEEYEVQSQNNNVSDMICKSTVDSVAPQHKHR